MANLLLLLMFSISDIFATFANNIVFIEFIFICETIICDICASFIIINYYK